MPQRKSLSVIIFQTRQPPAPGIAAQGAATGQPQVIGTSPSGGQYVFDPQMNAVIDSANGDVYDPTTRQHIGNLSQLAGSAELSPTAQSVAASMPAPSAAATPAAASGTAPVAGSGASSAGGVYVNEAGMYVDPQSGLVADPNTGNVYDAQGTIVANLDQPAA